MNAEELNRGIAQAREMWELVLHRKWMILFAGTLLSTLCVVGISSLPPKYTASTTVLIDPKLVPSVPEITTYAPLSATLNDELLSTVRLEEVAVDLHLCGKSHQCPPSVIDGMRANTTLTAKSGGLRNLSVLNIAYKSAKPQVAAQVAGRLAESFIEGDRTARERQANWVTEFLQTERQEAEKAYKDQQTKLDEFKMQHAQEMPELTGSAPVRLAEAQERLHDLEAEQAAALQRLELEKKAEAEQNIEHNVTPSDAPSVMERARLEKEQARLQEELANLRSHYSEEYPDVVQASARLENIRREVSHLPIPAPVKADRSDMIAKNKLRMAGITREIDRLSGERRRSLAEVGRYQALAGGSPQLQQEFADLNRDFAEAKKHYLSLEGKDFGLQLANELQHKQESERFTILDPARVPDVPDVNRKRQLLLFVSVPFCFLLSAGTVLFVERGVKGTIGTQDALQALLPVNVAVLGRIPMVARKWSLAAFLPRNGNGRNGARRRKGTALKNGTAEHGVKA